MTCTYNNRWICDDNVHTLAFDHKKLANMERQEITIIHFGAPAASKCDWSKKVLWSSLAQKALALDNPQSYDFGARKSESWFRTTNVCPTRKGRTVKDLESVGRFSSGKKVTIVITTPFARKNRSPGFTPMASQSFYYNFIINILTETIFLYHDIVV